MSAIGDSLTITYRLASNNSGSNPTTSGWHSSIRNTFLPSSALLAGSKKITSASNPSSASFTFPTSTFLLPNRTFLTSNSLKFNAVAFDNSSFISLYSTSEDTWEKAQLSTPIPPVKSATLRSEGILSETCGHPRPHKREGPAACGGRGREATVSDSIPSLRNPAATNALYFAVSEELHCSPESRKG